MVFTEKHEDLELTNQPADTPPRSDSPEVYIFGSKFLNSFDKVVTLSDLDELDQYLQGIGSMVLGGLNNPQSVLDWWKVRVNLSFLVR